MSHAPAQPKDYISSRFANGPIASGTAACVPGVGAETL